MVPRTEEYERMLADKLKAAREAVDALTSRRLHPDWDSEKISAILLVGSIGKGFARGKSDVDLLVLTEGKPTLLQRELKPLLQHIADRSKTVPYIDARTVNQKSFRKSLENRLTNGKVALFRMTELKRVISKTGGGKMHKVLDKAYPVIQQFFEKVRGKGIDESNTESHTGEEQLMSLIMYEKKPGTIAGMFSEAGMRPDGIFQFQGFDQVMGDYINGRMGMRETRKMLDTHAPYLWRTHLKGCIPTYEMPGHREMLRKLL